MWIKIVYERSPTPREQNRIYLGCFLARGMIEGILYKSPLTKIHGKNRISMTIANLSVDESNKIYELFRPEIGYGIIHNVIRIKSSREEDTENFLFYHPEFIKEVKGFNDGHMILKNVEIAGRIYYDNMDRIPVEHPEDLPPYTMGVIALNELLYE